MWGKQVFVLEIQKTVEDKNRSGRNPERKPPKIKKKNRLARAANPEKYIPDEENGFPRK